MFVDDTLINKLHDAIVWPELENTRKEGSRFEAVVTKLRAEGEVAGEGKLNLPSFLSRIDPELGAKAKLGASGERDAERRSEVHRSGLEVDNSERKLSELVAQYFEEFPERVLFVDTPGGKYTNYQGNVSEQRVEELLDSPPRPLIFMNVKRESPLFPTMAEAEGGGFRPIFSGLENALLGKLNPMPRYPSETENTKHQKKYWHSLKKNFKSRIAMQHIEKNFESGRVGWIDFRILFNDDGRTGHLHIVARGNYHAGVFGYNFVHRGYKYGCRIVGSLKAGNDINVLAIYER